MPESPELVAIGKKIKTETILSIMKFEKEVRPLIKSNNTDEESSMAMATWIGVHAAAAWLSSCCIITPDPEDAALQLLPKMFDLIRSEAMDMITGFRTEKESGRLPTLDAMNDKIKAKLEEMGLELP